ncbi:uncharacterized protein [Procambarus clarkii]|uniref:uncharacterized protein n=1 Tax=Procambarus clarkii TaxID=6728 RepID=UPI001E674F3C|nr:uncharacterized protein LOC123773924 [Procambarus clarkii]
MQTATAKSVMKTFSDCAYHIEKQQLFEEAIATLYGLEYVITIGLQGRMMFQCTVCNKEMNSEHALSEHNRSGTHQKNTDKVYSVNPGSSSALAQQYKKDSLQYKLATSNTKAIGLQFVEEFVEREGAVSYFKCNLCGAHGQMEPIYWHLIGTKHTEKYANIRVESTSSPVTAKNREEYRKFIIGAEGQRLTDIKTIMGVEHYPYEWIKQGRKHHSRAAGGTGTSQSAQSDEENMPMEAGEIGHEKNIDEAASLTVSEELPNVSRVSIGIQAQNTDVEPLENIMNKLCMMMSLGDDPAINIKSDEDALACLNVMKDLSLTLYEATNYKSSQTVNPREREELDIQKMNMSKVLGRVMQRLIPHHEAQLSTKLNQ